MHVAFSLDLERLGESCGYSGISRKKSYLLSNMVKGESYGKVSKVRGESWSKKLVKKNGIFRKDLKGDLKGVLFWFRGLNRLD